MKSFVVYYSKTGNTKKIAEAMAKELKTEARDARGVRESPAGSFLIAGSGVYASKAGKSMINFLESLSDVKGGKAAVFETSGDGETVKAGEQMKWILEKKGYKVVGSFVCPGQIFKLFRRGCPKPEHFEKARKFAAGLKKK